MIIGTILDDGAGGTGPGSTQFDGYAMMQFQTVKDAESWALIQSNLLTVGGYTQALLCSVINTDVNSIRWWYNGVEYTG